MSQGSPRSSVSGPASPVSVTGKDTFSVKIAEACNYVQNLVKVATLVGSTAAGQRFEFGSGARAAGVESAVGRKDVRKYVSLYVALLKDLKKIYREKKTNKKRKGTSNTGKHVKSLHYVSDQLVEFFNAVNLGVFYEDLGVIVTETTDLDSKGRAKLSVSYGSNDVNARNELAVRLRGESDSVAQLLKLVTKTQVASGSIFTSLFGHYRKVNSDNSGNIGKRLIVPDDQFLESFSRSSDTVWKFKKFYGDVPVMNERIEDLTDLEDKSAKYWANCDKSALERMHEEAGAKGLYTDWAFEHKMLMKLSNYFRIDPKLMALCEEPTVKSSTKELLEKLKSDAYLADAENIQSMLRTLKAVYDWADKPAESIRQKAIRASKPKKAKK